jgi:protein CpxP
MRDKWRQIGVGVVAALVVALAATSTVSAQNTNGAPPPFRGRGMRGGPMGGFGGPGFGLMPPLLNRLGLSDQQREQVKAIADSHRDDAQKLFDQERQAREALQAAITSGTFDEGAVRQQAMALGQVETDVAVLRARIFSEVYQVLTPEQQTTLKTRPQRRPRQ